MTEGEQVRLQAEIQRLEREGRFVDHTRLSGPLTEIAHASLVALTPSDGAWSMSPAFLREAPKTHLSLEMDAILRAAALVESGAAVGDDLSTEGVSSETNVLFLLSPLERKSALAEGEHGVMSGYYRGDFLSEARRLSRADVVPYALGGSFAFGGFRFGDGPFDVACRVVRDEAVPTEELHSKTAGRLFMATEGKIVESDDEISAELASEAKALEVATQLVYAQLLLDAPQLQLELGAPKFWFLGHSPEWMTDDEVEVDNLSQAQRYWASVAISVTDASLPRADNTSPSGSLPLAIEPFLVFLDEPDAALHATAQRHCVDGLVALSQRLNASVVVATHSREFLNHPLVTPQHVSRTPDGGVSVARLDSVQRTHADELGLTLADLVLLNRVIVVVEGVHDQVVLDCFIGDELAKRGVLVLPMRGGQLAATVVDSHLLAHFSDVPVIVALNNLDMNRVDAFWNELGAPTLNAREVDSLVAKHFSNSQRAEERFLIDYARSVVAIGQPERFRAFGFARADIIEYLPVEAFVPTAASWDELRAQFEAQQRFKSFKPWLADRYGVFVDELRLREAADVDSVHEDFGRLLDLCATVQHRPSTTRNT